MFKSKGDQITVNTIAVDNIDEMTARVESNRGVINVSRMPIPGFGWLCYFKAIEVKLFRVMHDNKSAK